ncbi:TonB-dependent receptor [Parasphingopyxis sp.]|uniref:TonB-dependent receptor n=1 Tax=Parasphingopyxis sp. TaxID=1920299 RepID=UPI0026268ED5|nr:TonB-dependent receptor [Parasphingopyxis sp.]
MNISRSTIRIAVLCGVSGFAVHAANASAQVSTANAEEQTELTGENPIVVTARKRDEDITDVPIAVTALGSEQLDVRGVNSVDEVLSFIPNASQSGGIAGGLQGLVSIRGISTLVRFVGLETGVGFYVDGVYIGRPENFNQELIDVERIEVLRGPQGALFGKNTVAGAINIITREPDLNQWTGDFELGYGNFDTVRAQGYVSGPLSDQVGVSLTAGYLNSSGFVENVSGIQPDLDAADLATFRTRLRFEPSSDFDLTISGDAIIDRGRPSFFEVSDVAFVDDPTENTPFTVNNDQPNELDRDIYGLSATANVAVGPGTWTTILAYRESSFDARLDDDKVPFRFFVDRFGSDVNFWSVESRYAAEIFDGVNLVAGLFYLEQDADNVSNFALGDFLTGVPGVEPPIDLISTVDTESIAAFFDLDIELTDRLALEVGGRFVSESKDASHVQNDSTGLFGSQTFAESRTDNDFAPTVSLRYEFTDELNGYVRFAQGFKSSGFNTDFVNANSNFSVDPEHATAYEVGLKGNFAGGTVRSNLAVFLTDYENLQLSQITGFGVTLNNAAEAEIFGIEFDIAAQLTDTFSVNAAIGYLDATYEDFAGCPVPGATDPAIAVANCAGNFLNLAPEWSTAVGAQWNGPVFGDWDGLVRVDWQYRSEIFFEPQNTARLSGDERHLVNLRAGLDNGTFSVFVWAENLFDEVYVNFADDRSAIFVNTTQSFGPPRTYGVTLGFSF